MNESILSNNLQQLMRIHGNLSVSELARLINMPQPTIHHILSGSTKNPRKKALEALSEFFSISIEQLLGKDALPHVIPEMIKEDLQLKTIPIIEWDILKHWPPATIKNLRREEVLLDKMVGHNSFALIVQDSSMEPLFPLNTLLIFDSDRNPKDRDFVIIHSKRDDNILFNRLFIDHNDKYLKHNLSDGNVKLIKLDRTDRIIAALTEVRIQY
ncbi:LexA family transcriptional regulator [Legionella brunensis]|uniref:HTH-type transcriptional regulator n=1 Tax=Legionella brunensis TaxID=29422 RepID=A0A0W0SNI6_9GAMM|nr:LexA family transcriptional regulator [Legionella brunensis]KTC84962.1 HTH-type transcriptional regulator [Legionella brunensis]